MTIPKELSELVEFLDQLGAQPSWQYLAIDMFEVGLDMSTSSSRAAATF